MNPRNSIAVCRDWQDASNDRDTARLWRLSAPEIKIIRPRSTAQGRDILEGWLSRAGLTLETMRTFARDESVVMIQRAGLGSSTREKTVNADLATRFIISGDCVSELSRYDTEDALDIALREANLDYGDEL